MSNYPLNILTSKEQDVIYQLFQMKEPDEEKLEKKIAKLLLPVGGILQSGDSYASFMEKLASKRKITLPVTGGVHERELFLYNQMMKQNLESMSQEQKDQFLHEITTEAQRKGLSKSEVGSISALMGIGAAQLSGFGVYILASSTVSAIAGLVGVTLPFAFYTTMSTVISYAIGPLGLILAAIPLYKTVKDIKSWQDLKNKGNQIYKGFKVFTKGNYELAEIVFSYFAATRILKLAEYENRYEKALKENEKINSKIKENQELLERENQKLNTLSNEITPLEKQLKILKSKYVELLNKHNLVSDEIIKDEARTKVIKNEMTNIQEQKNKLLGNSQLRQNNP